MRVAMAAALVCGTLWATPPALAAPDPCAALGGLRQAEGLCHVEASTANYTMDVTYPAGYPDEEAILDYLTETRDGFVNVSEAGDARNMPHEMKVTAESFESASTRSAVLTLFQDIGSAHPTTWYKSFTYDIIRGLPVTLDALFAADARPMDAIAPFVQRSLEEQTGLVGSISPGDARDPSHYQNFAVTDDAVIFFFGRAELLPSYAGATSVSVPRNVLPPLRV
jgi:hypothetical protein